MAKITHIARCGLRLRTGIVAVLLGGIALGCEADPDDAAVFDAPTARLIPVASVGADLAAPPEYQFNRISSIDADGEGGVWVVDGAGTPSPRIRRFSASGEFVQSLGRVGDGPGEFRGPDQLLVLSDGRAAVRDPLIPGRITVFHPDGSLAGVWSMGRVRQTLNSGGGIREDTAGRLWLRFNGGRLRDGGASGYVLATPDGELLDVIPSPPLPEITRTPVRVSRPGGGTTRGYRIPYAPSVVMAWHPAGGFLTMRTDLPRVTVLQPERTRGAGAAGDASDGPVEWVYRESRSVRLSGERARIGEREREALRTDLRNRIEDYLDGSAPVPRIPEPPSLKPVARSVFVESDTLLMVVPFLPSEFESGAWTEPQVLDVYSLRTGRPLGRIPVPPGSGIGDLQVDFDGRWLWMVVANDLGVESVRRFEVVWGHHAAEER